jgi:hypothetical protein
MSLRNTVFQSPSGLIHIAGLLPPRSYSPQGRAITECGREVNLDTWTRFSGIDDWMFGKSPSTIAKHPMLEGSKCDKCFRLRDGR